MQLVLVVYFIRSIEDFYQERDIKGCVDLLFSIAHDSIFITYNLKLVSSLVEGFVWI